MTPCRSLGSQQACKPCAHLLAPGPRAGNLTGAVADVHKAVPLRRHLSRMPNQAGSGTVLQFQSRPLPHPQSVICRTYATAAWPAGAPAQSHSNLQQGSHRDSGRGACEAIYLACKHTSPTRVRQGLTSCVKVAPCGTVTSSSMPGLRMATGPVTPPDSPAMTRTLAPPGCRTVGICSAW